jgi:hypothetical protein
MLKSVNAAAINIPPIAIIRTISCQTVVAPNRHAAKVSAPSEPNSVIVLVPAARALALNAATTLLTYSGPRIANKTGTTNPQASKSPLKLIDAFCGPMMYPTPRYAELIVGPPANHPPSRTLPLRVNVAGAIFKNVKKLVANNLSSPAILIAAPAAIAQKRYLVPPPPPCPAL